MNRRLVSLLGFVLLALLSSFAFPGQSQSKGRSNISARPASMAANHQLNGPKRQASAKTRFHAMNQPGIPANLGFLSATQIPAGGSPNSPYASTMGGFDDLGDTGVATVVNDRTSHNPQYALSVVISNADGTFQAPQLTPTGDTQWNPIWSGELDGSANGNDIVILEPATPSTPASINVWLNNGDGTFSQGNNYPVTTVNADNIVWGTLVQDTTSGNLDFVAVDAANPATVWTLLGNGDDTFQAPTSASAVSGQLGPVQVAFADFNNDGLLDFVGADASTNQLMVYINNGAGGYAAPVPLTTSDGKYDACSVVAGDLNGDGIPEIVAANCQDNNVTVYVNSGTGTFSNPTGYYYAGRLPEAIAIADMNGDGNNDVVAANAFGGDVSVLLGNGDGTLQTPNVGYATGGYPGGNPFGSSTYATVPPLLADFNGDGIPDVMVADSFFSFVFLPGYGDGSFQTSVDYYAPIGVLNPFAAGMASGDFTGSGITDFVIGNNKSYSGGRTGITVFLGNPDGTMQTGVPQGGVATNGVLAYVATADFQKRGILDIVATDMANGGIQMFTGNGNGTFVTANTYASDTQSGSSTLGIAVGDFNGDGYPDVAVVNAYNSGANLDVGVLINNKQGGFNTVVNYQLNNTSQAGVNQIIAEITAADLNSDGKLDLLIPDFGTQSNSGQTIMMLYGNGDGTFQPESGATDITVTTNPRYVAVADLNHDGIPDMAITVDDGATNFQGLDVYLQSPVGAFNLSQQCATGQDTSLHVPVPSYVRVADINGDGSPDLAYTNSNYGTVGILFNTGTGQFADCSSQTPPVEYPVGGGAYNLALADVNHGGAVNVVAADGNASELTVLLNTAAAPNTVGSSINPSTAGLSVTFTAGVSAIRGVSGAPSGTVTFYDGNTAISNALPLNSGTASFTGILSGGMHNITSRYSGDSNFFSSTSLALKQMVSLASSTTGLGSSLNPAAPKQAITFTAKVTDSQSGDALLPTGTVTFYDGSKVLGSAAMSSQGVASMSTSSLATGSHSVTAQYSGDTNFQPTGSQAVDQIVTSTPDYSLLPTPDSRSVVPGSEASYTVTLTPINGYDGAVSFACPAASSLPSGVTCTAPANTKAPYQPGTLTLTTTGPSAFVSAPQDLKPHHGDTNILASLSGVGMLGIVLAGDWKKRNRRRMAIVLVVVALAMILAMAGCGSGSSAASGGGHTGGGGNGGTPAGTYHVTLTASGTAGSNFGNTGAHQMEVTLIVQ